MILKFQFLMIKQEMLFLEMGDIDFRPQFSNLPEGLSDIESTVCQSN